MSTSWPSSWQGQISLECGDCGYIRGTVSTEGIPSETQQESFEAIEERWAELWPVIQQALEEHIQEFRPVCPPWDTLQFVRLELTDEPIHNGGEWAVSVEFKYDPTMWSLPFSGWAPSLGEITATN